MQVAVVVQVLYLALFALFLLLIARLVIGAIVRFSRRWEPNRGAAIAFELVFSVTDPPLNGLRRFIPPLRLGTVAFDLAFVVLFLLVMILRVYVATLL